MPFVFTQILLNIIIGAYTWCGAIDNVEWKHNLWPELTVIQYTRYLQFRPRVFAVQLPTKKLIRRVAHSIHNRFVSRCAFLIATWYFLAISNHAVFSFVCNDWANFVFNPAYVVFIMAVSNVNCTHVRRVQLFIYMDMHESYIKHLFFLENSSYEIHFPFLPKKRI